MDTPRFHINLSEYDKQIEKLGERFSLKVDPSAKIWQLSVGEQQRVELLKMLYRGAEVLIMDEPTAVLAPQEIEDLFDTLRSMTQGKGLHTQKFERYEEVPGDIMARIVEEAKKEKEAA